MASVSALIAVLPLMVLEAIGQGVGYIGIRQPPTSSQTAGGVSASPALARGVFGSSDSVGDIGRGLSSQRGGKMEEPPHEWDLKQRLTKTAPTSHVGIAGLESTVESHATSNFVSHGMAEDVKHEVAAFQPNQQTKQQQQQRPRQHRVSLQNMDNVQYFGEMMVGEPPQRMKILFDTGSSDTWVPGIGCTSCGLHSAFDALASSTAVSMGRNFSNRYDSGSVEGSVIKERVLVGGMAVNGVEMGLVRRQEQHIRGFKADGIVGLAFPSISTTRNTSPSQHPTFMQLLQEQFGVVGDLFSVYLTPSLNQPGSMVIFGGYDLDLVRRRTASPRKHPVPQTTVARGSDDDSRTQPSTASRQPDARQGHRRVWQRGPAQSHLRGGTVLQQNYQAYRAAADRGGDLDGGAWSRGDGAAADSRRDEGASGHPGWKRSIGGVREVDGLSMPYSAAAATGRSPEEIHGEGYRARADGQEEDEAAAIENQRVLEAAGRAGEGEAQRAIEDAGVNSDEEGDEPVIVWTPVIEYRGSLSYWTVQLTGWRTEPTTEAPGGGIDHGHGTASAAAAVEQEQAYSSEEQTRKNTGKGITTGRDLCPVGCQAIVDTGSSLLVPPRSQYRAVMHQITGDRTDCQERRGMVSCSRCSLAEFPDIVISVAVSSGQTSSTIPRPASVRGPHGDVDGGARRNTEQQGNGGDGSGGGGNGMYQEFRLKPSDYLSQSWDGCEILVGEGRATDIWTLGDAFIKTYMTIFDVANLRVGFVCPDGGRCVGGASPPWLPSTRFCWPFMGSLTDPVESADVRDAYCVYLHYSFVGWALMLASALLFLAGCMLCAEESGSSGGRSRSSTVSWPSPPQPSEQHSLVPNPPFPFLITGQQEQQELQLELQLESAGDVASGDCSPEAAHGGRGGGGGGGGGGVGGNVGTVGSQITTPQRRRDGHRKGAGGRVLPGWLRGSKDFLISMRVRPKVTNAPQRSPPPTPCSSCRAPSKTAHSAADQHRPRQQWPPHNGGDGKGGSGAGGAGGALGTFRSDGMRSRGGTPRPDCSSSPSVGGGHHQF